MLAKPTVTNWAAYLAERAASSSALNLLATLSAVAAAVSSGMIFAAVEKGMDLRPEAVNMLGKITLPLIQFSVLCNMLANAKHIRFASYLYASLRDNMFRNFNAAFLSIMFYIVPLTSFPLSLAFSIAIAAGANFPVQATLIPFAFATMVNDILSWYKTTKIDKNDDFKGFFLYLAMQVASGCAAFSAFVLEVRSIYHNVETGDAALASQGMTALLAAYAIQSLARAVSGLAPSLLACGVFIAAAVRNVYGASFFESAVYFGIGLAVNYVTELTQRSHELYDHPRPASVFFCRRDNSDGSTTKLLP